MNYAEKELREAMAYLDQARATETMLKATLRALELGEPVEISFRSAHGTAVVLCPVKTGQKMLYQLVDKAADRTRELEKQEVYWCQEVAHVDRQRQITEALHREPHKSYQTMKEAFEQPLPTQPSL